MPTSSQSRSSHSRGRGGSPARSAIIEMLKEDHKRARKAFRDFERLDPEKDPEACAQIVAQCCAELTLHATLEEELFYPAARNVLADEDLIDEAEVEHASAKELIAQLERMQPGEDKFAARFTVLGEYIKHHIKEEEGEMFPRLTSAKLDWQALQAEMLSRRERLSAQLLPMQQAEDPADTGPGDEEEDDDSDEGRADGGRSKALRVSASRNRAASSRRGAGSSRKG